MDEKFKDTAKLFLNYLDPAAGITKEISYASRGPKLRNRIDLLCFAMKRGDSEKIKIQKQKIVELKCHPISVVELFVRLQNLAP